MHALGEALGQYVLYKANLYETEPERTLYLAVPDEIRNTTLDERMARNALKLLHTPVIAFDPDKEVLTEWITF